MSNEVGQAEEIGADRAPGPGMPRWARTALAVVAIVVGLFAVGHVLGSTPSPTPAPTPTPSMSSTPGPLLSLASSYSLSTNTDTATASMYLPLRNDSGVTVQIVSAVVLPNRGEGLLAPDWVTATVATVPEATRAESGLHQVLGEIPKGGLRMPSQSSLTLVLTVRPTCPATDAPASARIVLDYYTPEKRFTQEFTDADLPTGTTPWIRNLIRGACSSS